MAESAREAQAMIGWLTRLLKVDAKTPYAEQPDTQAAKVKVNLRELEQSQAKLKRAVDDTGFFLGDALVRQQHDRARADNHNR